MYSEDDYIMISALSHYVFCPRRCALIHVDGLWSENVYTTRGKLFHERVDSGEDESRGDTRIIRSLNIYSRRLGLSGRCDVVEFHDVEGTAVPYPVEYKSGKPKMDICDLAQVCAQALCLEEMTLTPVREAAIYYGKPRRRLLVELDDGLRKRTEEIVAAVHAMIETRSVPSARREKKCETCSINGYCMPGTGNRKLSKYIEELFTADEAAP
jgi:CRISPR-associated exonuclease Cas4